MDFAFSAEHDGVRKLVRDFAAREIRPGIQENDRRGRFDGSVLSSMGKLGLLGVCIPVTYGGAGMDYVSLGIVCEELEYVDTSARVIMSVHVGLNSLALFQWGTEAQKQRFLIPQARGQRIAAFGLTEPDAGTDVAALRATARRDGDSYVLNGEKNFITNGPQADWSIIFAFTDKSKGHRGISAFLVHKDTPGY
ncbi:MAG: acyl-CoA dehydrogenase family protein, partial [Anaerolineae bacterium]